MHLGTHQAISGWLFDKRNDAFSFMNTSLIYIYIYIYIYIAVVWSFLSVCLICCSMYIHSKLKELAIGFPKANSFNESLLHKLTMKHKPPEILHHRVMHNTLCYNYHNI